MYRRSFHTERTVKQQEELSPLKMNTNGQDQGTLTVGMTERNKVTQKDS